MRGHTHVPVPAHPPACLDARRMPLDGVKPDIQCVRTHWIRGFMAFRLTRRTRIVMLVVPV